MNPGPVRQIAGREIRERVRTKSFAALTALNVLLILGAGAVAAFGGDDGPDRSEIAVTEPVPETLSAGLVEAGTAVGRVIEVVPARDGTAAIEAVEDGDVDAAVVTGRAEIVFRSDPDERLAALVQQVWAHHRSREALVRGGLAPEAAAAALSPEPLALTFVDEPDDDTLAMVVGTTTSILLFVTMQTFGGYVLVGVVEEKATGVGEILLSRVRPGQLLAGKVIGIGATALVQVAATVAAGFAALPVAGVDVPGAVWATLPAAIGWFVGGYALYATGFALAGALVSRQEDAQAAAAPITTLLIAAYMAVYVFGYVPESTASRVLSLVPLLAPFLMPMRMAAGAASVVEIAMSFLLLLAAVLVTARLAGRIYERVVLHRGARIPWREALKFTRMAPGVAG